jgi:replicative DNA helicase
MNIQPMRRDFAIPAPDRSAVDLEQAVLHAVMVAPERLADFAQIATPEDFSHPAHARIAEHLLALHEAEREPSITALLALFGDEEFEPGLSAKDYIGKLFVGGTNLLAAPWRDTVETWKDALLRRRLFAIGGRLQLAATTSIDPFDLAHGGVDDLDDVIAAQRAGRLREYDAGGAADMAIAHLEGDAPAYPTTGLADLDHMIGGWPRGQLSIIAGRPGMGKSAIATSTFLKAARKGHAGAFFSLEMVGEQLGARLLTDIAYQHQSPIQYEDMLHRRLTDRDKSRIQDAARVLRDLPVRIIEQRGLTMAEIAARSRKLASEFDRHGHPLEVIYVDHMLLVKASQRYAGNRVREVAEISDGLATLAKELNVAVVALCQLNRGVEGRESKRPSLSDLRDSGAIEEDASVVIFAFRPAYYLERERFDDATMEEGRQERLRHTKHVLEFGIAKNRNGRIGVIKAFVDIGANAIRNAGFEGGR